MRPHWITSALIAFHVVALTLAAVPSPRSEEFRSLREREAASSSSALDQLAGIASTAATLLHAVFAPMERLTSTYAAGLPQNWVMFSDPWREDQYVRIDYFVQKSGEAGPSVVSTLVFPTQNEEHVRWTHVFRDKATSRSLEAFGSDASTRLGEGGQDRTAGLRAIVRHDRARFSADHLQVGDRVARVEVWHGVAPIPPPGSTSDAQAVQSRLNALREYRDRRPEPGPVRPPATVGTIREQLDILWQLIYVDHSDD